MKRLAVLRIPLFLGLALHLVGSALAQVQLAPPNGKLPEPYPLEITIKGPTEFFVDQTVTFEIDVRNTGKKALAARKLKVEISRLDVSAFPGGRNTTVYLQAAACSQNAVRGDRLLSLKPLEPDGTQTFSLKLTFRHNGDNMVLRVGEPESFSKAGPRGGMPSPDQFEKGKAPEPPRIGEFSVFKVTYDPKTPLADILPAPPKTAVGPPRLPASLAEVPELSLQQHVAKFAADDESMVQAMRQTGRINLLNDRKTDAFIEQLLAQRPDLAELPFALGDACRPNGERNRQFGLTLLAYHKARFQDTSKKTLAPMTGSPSGLPPPGDEALPLKRLPPVAESIEGTSAGRQPPRNKNLSLLPSSADGAERLMDNFRKLCLDDDNADKRLDSRTEQQRVPARVAALMQVISVEHVDLQLAIVKHLSATSHAEATRALAKLALFSDEATVRDAATLGLRTRRERDYTDVLLAGLSYPWPAVARRSSEAIVKLERNDLVPQLLDVLERPDPRLPEGKTIGGKKITVMRELVRINHQRNCLLCHPPIDDAIDNLPQEKADTLDMLLAPIPLADKELPKRFADSGNYDDAILELAVRLDATYLRQDFSVQLPVADAQPWPEMQRFDFLVRTRQLSEEEAKAWTALQPSRPGELSPYHSAALFALRELTGLDTEPTAAAWRRLLAQLP